MTTYRAVMLTRKGGPEVLETVEPSREVMETVGNVVGHTGHGRNAM